MEEPPFVEIEPGHSAACWKVGDLMLELDGVTKVYKTGMFGRGELIAVPTSASPSQPARSSR